MHARTQRPHARTQRLHARARPAPHKLTDSRTRTRTHTAHTGGLPQGGRGIKEERVQHARVQGEGVYSRVLQALQAPLLPQAPLRDGAGGP